MTKLQKLPPPAYPGRPTSMSTASLQHAVPYESLPQTTQQPVPVMSAVTPASYSDLPSTNPFSANFAPQPAPTAGQPSPFSPVSPLVETEPLHRRSQAAVAAPTLHRPDANQRRSRDLRRLDGKPYPGSHPAEESAKSVRVAKDMHNGALPPTYRRQAPELIQSPDVSQASTNSPECKSCGKKRVEGQDCGQCGKRKSSAPTAATTTPPASHHTPTPSEESTTAGPSSSPGSSAGGGVRCCNKCGRHKRPQSIDQGRRSHVLTVTEPMPMASHPAMRIHQAGLSIRPDAPAQRNSVYPQIDVIPPSTTSFKPSIQSPFSNYGDESPLVERAVRQEIKPVRHSSLIRSLSRRLSRRDKNKTPPAQAPLPSQQLANDENQSGEQSAGRLINMISTAMQGPPADRDTNYSLLNVGEQLDRPTTPFSFVGGKDEQDAFEMVDMRERESISDKDSWKEGAEGISSTRPEGDAIPQDTIDVVPRSKSADPFSQHLSIPDADRPQITRFKSLRSGVSRMNSNISRSTSLKRLGSLKTAHHAWYRDDMAIEGHMGENAVPAF
ncbi:hypothetical protein LTR99_007283 [Exophiala xenobiotica]|uniref:Uncharacterized protein n=1 Tax=Vermiconidia calcicola TaxID=1690605 RepID=A0AAV9Q387_9PEZI|nr:hypothetical protein LTR96_007922 [Exophiala xenobiotica]KAK5534393.1 hypothetical protein LTR25_006425 [Vermiconidia calcicola]KAK5536160.1 hypothetical protein LTR23_008181 [Chaetothyriales sp. CCFEE 6169]KAK5299015.1 hypothetical protein LTR99_007283 [Exophiala xenobiotica]KAK5334702.1 hypothetical protein LTR98_009075 [Exophiala xenobiotica]